MNASSTCTFSAPVDFQGNAPALPTDIWNFSAENCDFTYEAASSTPASSSIETVNGFTKGELVIGYFLLALLILTAYAFLYFWVRGVKIRP